MLAVTDTGPGWTRQRGPESSSRSSRPSPSARGRARARDGCTARVKQSGGGYIWLYTKVGQKARASRSTCRGFDAVEPHAAADRSGGVARRLRDGARRRGMRTRCARSSKRPLGKPVGYRVMVARDGTRPSPWPAVMPGRNRPAVTDVVMPDMNGRVLSQTPDAGASHHQDALSVRPTPTTRSCNHGVLEEGVAFLQKKPFSLGALATQGPREVIGDPPLRDLPLVRPRAGGTVTGRRSSPREGTFSYRELLDALGARCRMSARRA